MKILVFSDSHRNIRYISKALSEHGETAEFIVHLGDEADDLPDAGGQPHHGRLGGQRQHGAADHLAARRPARARRPLSDDDRGRGVCAGGLL